MTTSLTDREQAVNTPVLTSVITPAIAVASGRIGGILPLTPGGPPR